VIVFPDCTCPGEISFNTPDVNSLDAADVGLIQAMAKANPHTAVVTNVNVATLMPWLSQVKSVLNMWFPGSEGGTATARLLLGRADPGGHLTSTWPVHATDNIWEYNETRPLYPGDTTGTHPERNPTAGPTVSFDEGIFVGYRFFDREGIRPLFPFGFGLSYTKFRFSGLHVTPTRGGGLNVAFQVANRVPPPAPTWPRCTLVRRPACRRVYSRPCVLWRASTE
jgi:beta-glucosidase